MLHLETSHNMYDTYPQYGYDFDQVFDFMANNRLFCTFTALEALDELILELSNRYSIMYNKMFVLHVKSNNEYVTDNYNHMSFTLRSPGGSNFVSMWLQNSG